MINLTGVKTNNFGPLEDGKYICSVTDVEVKDTKDGSGQYIAATLTVAEGDNKGRKIFTNFNIKNKSEKAVEIGLGQLKSLLEQAKYKGDMEKFTPSNLNGLLVGVKTKTKNDPAYGDKVEVSYYFEASQSQGANQDLGKIPF